MNDAERLRVLVRALLPFALAAKDDEVELAEGDEPLMIEGTDRDGRYYLIYLLQNAPRWLRTGDLHVARMALGATGYADALADDSARAALEGGNE